MPLQISGQNTYKFSPPKPIEEYSKDSIRKMAVLFTDIVGSSKYFKAHGDIAGRRMLKLHQDMASPIIAGFRGNVVKMLGDSVMAFFLSPDEALKSAIKLQQKFQAYNKDHKEKDQIHIRICIHYGDGIIEEGDIFGDVVNMAAKFLPHTDGDEIIISDELHSNLEEPAFAYFDKYEYKDNSKVLHGITLFKVIWDQSIPLDPTLKTLVIFRPVWGLGKKDFTGIWNNLLDQISYLFPENMVEKMQINRDKSVNVIVNEAPMAIAVARKLLNYLRTNMGHDGLMYIPVQIVIDSGPYLLADQISLGGLNVNWKEIEPGDIHISKKAFNFVKTENDIDIDGLVNIGRDNRFIKVTDKKTRKQIKTNIFKYQNALIQGDHTPCFYCGSRAHATSDCPSKEITELTHFIEKLGYMTLSEINNLFFNYLNDSRLNNHITDAADIFGETGSTQLAHHAFYELKNVFQLRLLRAIWNLQEDNWNRIWDKRDENEKGGLLWIGFDCIRVSNFDQAESIIQNELSKKNPDFRLSIITALLFIEKNHLQQAMVYLKKALDNASRTPQKIYILFLLSRIFYLSDDIVKAREMLRKINRLSPYCTEAIYQEIVFNLQHGDRSAALDQLAKLIKKNKDYYVISLIDPELSNYSNKIHSRLEHILSEARQSANDVIPRIKKEVANLENVMGKDSEEIGEAKSVASKVDELLKTDSYFGYLDIIHYGENISRLSKRIIEGREMRLYKRQRSLKRRIQKCHNYLEILQYAFLTASVTHELKIVEKKLELISEKIKLEGMGDFRELLRLLDSYSNEMNLIESRIRRVDAFTQFVTFAVKFLKKNFIFQSVNLVISLILLPIMVHYLNFLIPGLNLSTEGIWHYQKILIALGGISGLILATIASQSGTSR
jgi:tetratricopeptide (TPR) repeat protein